MSTRPSTEPCYSHPSNSPATPRLRNKNAQAETATDKVGPLTANVPSNWPSRFHSRPLLPRVPLSRKFAPIFRGMSQIDSSSQKSYESFLFAEILIILPSSL